MLEAPRLQLVDERPRWSVVKLKGHKLLVPVSAKVVLRQLSQEQLSQELLRPARGQPVTTGSSTVLRIEVHFRSPVKDLRTRLWFRSRDAAVLQRSRLELTPGQERYKIYRYTAEGLDILRRKPRQGEAGVAPMQWSTVSRDFDPYPPGTPGDMVVADPAVLFYLAAVLEFDSPGEEVRLLAYFDDALQLITIRYAGDVKIGADFELHGRGGTHRIRGERRAMRLDLSAHPLEQDAGREGITIAGLERPTLFVDRQWRVPLELRGRIKVLGMVSVQLDEVELVR